MASTTTYKISEREAEATTQNWDQGRYRQISELLRRDLEPAQKKHQPAETVLCEPQTRSVWLRSPAEGTLACPRRTRFRRMEQGRRVSMLI